MVALLVLAFVLELVGLVCAAIGFSQTWHEHAQGQDFWAPVKTRWQSSRVNRFFRRLLRRPPRVVYGRVASEIEVASSIRAKVTPGPLPDPSVDLSAFAEKVQHYIGQLYEMTQRTDHVLADEKEAREATDKEIRTKLDTEVTRLEGMSQKVAVGGLRFGGDWLDLPGSGAAARHHRQHLAGGRVARRDRGHRVPLACSPKGHHTVLRAGQQRPVRTDRKAQPVG